MYIGCFIHVHDKTNRYDFLEQYRVSHFVLCKEVVLFSNAENVSTLYVHVHASTFFNI